MDSNDKPIPDKEHSESCIVMVSNSDHVNDITTHDEKATTLEVQNDGKGERSPLSKLTKSIIFFHILELLSLPKYFVLPGLVLYLLGGPTVLTFPWAIWAAVGYGLHFSFFLNRKNPTVEPSMYLNLLHFFRFRYAAVDHENDGSSDSINFEFSYYEIIGSIVWSLIDIVCSAVTATVSLILQGFIMDPDLLVATGWESANAYIIASLYFCFISILARVAMIVCYFLVYWRASHTTTRISRDNISNGTASILFRFKGTFGAMYLLFAVTGLIYFIAVLAKFGSDSSSSHEQSANYSNCDPMVGKICSLPYPSSYWLASDSSTETGSRIRMTDHTLPFTIRGEHLTGSYLNDFDGFSVAGSILWHLPGVIEAQLTDHKHINDSTTLKSTTLLIDVENKQLHPHFSQKDHLDDNEDDPISYMQPAVAMNYKSHYLAVIKGLTDSQSNLLPPSSHLKGYLDAYTGSTAYLGSSSKDQARYERFKNELFPLLEELKIPLTSVQLAWDFQTASMSSLLRKPLNMYASAKLTLEKNVVGKKKEYYRKTLATYSDCSTSSDDPEALYSSVYYRIDVPWFMKSLERSENLIREELLRGGPQEVPMSGQVGLRIAVPCSVYNSQKVPSVLLEFGHGVFGSRNELTLLNVLAEDSGMIIYAMDWRGFSYMEQLIIGRMLVYDGDATIKVIADSLLQSFVSKLAGQVIVRQILENEKADLGIPLSVDVSKASLPGKYIGNSMGSILGSGYTAFSGYKDVVLLVGGSPLSFLLSTCYIFKNYLGYTNLQFFRLTDFKIALTLWQQLFDSVESSGWVGTGRYAQMSTLLQVGLGDSVVSTISGQILARQLNSSQLLLAVESVYHVPLLSVASVSSPANILYQANFPDDAKSLPSTVSIPEKDTNVHYCLPNDPMVRMQHKLFLLNGTISNPCGANQCKYDDRSTCAGRD